MTSSAGSCAILFQCPLLPLAAYEAIPVPQCKLMRTDPVAECCFPYKELPIN